MPIEIQPSLRQLPERPWADAAVGLMAYDSAVVGVMGTGVYCRICTDVWVHLQRSSFMIIDQITGPCSFDADADIERGFEPRPVHRPEVRYPVGGTSRFLEVVGGPVHHPSELHRIADNLNENPMFWRLFKRGNATAKALFAGRNRFAEQSWWTTTVEHGGTRDRCELSFGPGTFHDLGLPLEPPVSVLARGTRITLSQPSADAAKLALHFKPDRGSGRRRG